eukprot:TRINITY_DN9092_c0_g2_i1.p1 TRINITY_DN9092_c0_g2~~TRINITY_DN9092_c0_g2_i1.p1  ORF type:complete len:420 (-),score=86.03 TRINITY_DN9092_c0_g2_i1:396-1595(-)
MSVVSLRKVIRFVPNDRILCIATDGAALTVGSANGGVFFWPKIFASLLFQTPVLCTHAPEITIAVHCSQHTVTALFGDLYMQTWKDITTDFKKPPEVHRTQFPRPHSNDACLSTQTLSCPEYAVTITKNSARVFITDFVKLEFRSVELPESVPFHAVLCTANKNYVAIKCLITGDSADSRIQKAKYRYQIKVYCARSMAHLHTVITEGSSCVDVYDEEDNTNTTSAESRQMLVCVDDDTNEIIGHVASSNSMAFKIKCDAAVISLDVLQPTKKSRAFSSAGFEAQQRMDMATAQGYSMATISQSDEVVETALIAALLADSTIMFVKKGAVVFKASFDFDPLIDAELIMTRLHFFESSATNLESAPDTKSTGVKQHAPLLLINTSSAIFQIKDWHHLLNQ